MKQLFRTAFFVCAAFGIGVLADEPTTGDSTQASREVLKTVHAPAGGVELNDRMFDWKVQGHLLGENIVMASGVDQHLYFYQPPAKRYWVKMTASKFGMNMFLNAETTKDNAREFLKKTMIDFLGTNLVDPPNVMLTDSEVDSDLKYDDPETPKFLRKIYQKPFVVMVDNIWTCQFQVATRQGAIESFTVSGTVAPLKIVDIDQRTSAPPGSFVPPTITG